MRVVVEMKNEHSMCVQVGGVEVNFPPSFSDREYYGHRVNHKWGFILSMIRREVPAGWGIEDEFILNIASLTIVGEARLYRAVIEVSNDRSGRVIFEG